MLKYSFNSTSGRTFQFSVPRFLISEQLLRFYADLAPSRVRARFVYDYALYKFTFTHYHSPSSCDVRVLRLNSLEIALQPIPRYSFLTYYRNDV